MIQDPHGYLEDVEPLVAWLEDLLRSRASDGDSLGVRLVDDEEMTELNRRFRHRSGTTDVLSFEAPPGPEETAHVGDVVLSVPTARRQAHEAGHDLDRELRILLLHGVLHCLGYDHETDDGEMDRLEHRLRREWVDD